MGKYKYVTIIINRLSIVEETRAQEMTNYSQTNHSSHCYYSKILIDHHFSSVNLFYDAIKN